MITKSTITFFLIINIIFCFSRNGQAQCHIDDWTALKALYESTDGDNWNDNTGWEIIKGNNPAIDCDLESLIGVNLNDDGRVVYLKLWKHELTGNIPNELENLTYLTYLSLSYNQLDGSIPPKLGSLSNLNSLFLNNNELSGNIPPELGSLSMLRSLNLSGNKIAGNIPPELIKLSNLERLDLSDNQIDGNIPPELGNLIKLESLVLSKNLLTGGIPFELSNLSSLERLDLSDNQLTGIYPSEISNLCGKLSYDSQIDEANNFEVTWDSFCTWGDYAYVNVCNLDDWTALKTLYESTNGDNWKIRSGWDTIIDNLTEPPPNCNLRKLYGVKLDSFRVTSLDLSSNQLNGSIPAELVNLSNLKYLDLEFNQLNGFYPSELFSLCNQLSYPQINEGNNFELSWNVFCTWGNPYINVCNLEDWTVLKALYESTDGDNWDHSRGWEEIKGDAPSSNCNLQYLHGISLNDQGRVSSLDLSRNKLNGSIPAELSNLINLTILELDWNYLTGKIPVELSKLSNLTVLSLSGNRLIDSIPIELSKLSDLTVLSLNNNQLSGSIPADLSKLSDLTVLSLYDNELRGNIPIQLGKLSDLTVLYLSGNELSGSISNELGNLSNLTSLYLFDNQLTGSIPPQLGNLSNLTSLDLYNNQLSGSIPYELGNLSNLISLDLYNNQLSGSIPNELGNLINLISLDLYNNQLSGSIPNELGNLSNLKSIDFYENQLSGSIPAELGNLSNLVWLNLYNNQLGGSIPYEISNLSNLKSIDLSNNQLTGSIPNEIGSLSKLKSIDLSNNQLSGNIPPQLGYIRYLENLSLGINELSGNIPSELGNLIYLEKLSLRYNQLSGSIPPGLGNSPYLETLYLAGNQLSGAFPPGLSNLCDQLSHIAADEDILYTIELGNNFDMPWRVFCIWGEHAYVNVCDIDDWTALKAFYESTNGDNWYIRLGWDTEIANLNAPPPNCNLRKLRGAVLDSFRVTNIVIYNNQLSGSLPPEIGKLSNLKGLTLPDNQLSGSLPAELGNLSNLNYLDLHSNQLSGNIPYELRSLRLYLWSNYFTCENLKNTSNSHQYFKPVNYENIKANVYDTITINQSLKIDFPFDTTGYTYQWFRNDRIIPGANQPVYIIDTVQNSSIGKYTLQVDSESCLLNESTYTATSDPIYVILKGFDLRGQPVEYNQIMVEFDNKDETEEYEDRILTPNAGWVKHACNCNRELYLWEFPSTEAAIAALLQIDQKIKNLKRKNRPSGGFNNSLSIGDSVKNKIAYRVFLDQINQNFNDSVVVYILDSGLDTLDMNSSEFVYNQAPVDACYGSDVAVGYSYTDSAVISTNYIDNLWHGTFGFESITQDLTTENNPLKIVPLKIFNDKGEGNLFDLVCAMYHAIDHNADIINISAGYQGEASDILEKAISLARQKGIFITAAAGNDTINIDSIPYYPAYYANQYDVYETIDTNLQVTLNSVRYDNLISIASINANDSLSQFSNYGSEAVTIATYGENIHSHTLGSSDAVASGTSMATYFATKALALEISKNRNRNYQKVWEDFEKNWLVENPILENKTRTGKQINFKIEETDIEGCTDLDDPNYFLFATIDDGSCLTDVDENYNSHLTDVEIYPNPAKEKVLLKFNQVNFSTANIQVFNLPGDQILHSTVKNSNTIELNLRGFLKGIYIIQIITDKERIIKKLVIQ